MATVMDVLLDTLLDILKLLPFLFLTYLLLEWMESETEHRFEHMLESHRSLAPLSGTLLGLVPSCGFSSAASSLYATGVISGGTLAAVYLSTSDEMIPIMISQHADFAKVWPVLAVKVIFGLTAGYALDFFSRRRKIDVGSFCEREHDDHSHGILHSAVMHTLQIAAWLFAITLLFNGLVEIIGEETLRGFVAMYPNKSVLVCTLIGMIPSCASSIILSTMYLEGIISFAAVCAGLLANAGAGIMVLFRVNPKLKDNLAIIFYVWIVSAAAGLILSYLPV